MKLFCWHKWPSWRVTYSMRSHDPLSYILGGWWDIQQRGGIKCHKVESKTVDTRMTIGQIQEEIRKSNGR